MNKIFLLSFMFILIFPNLVFSSTIFNTDEQVLYNNQFLSPDNPDDKIIELLIGGETSVGWNLEFASEGNELYYQDNKMIVECDYLHCGTTTVTYPFPELFGQENFTIMYSGYQDDYSQLNVILSNSTGYQAIYVFTSGTNLNTLGNLNILSPNKISISYSFTCSPGWLPGDWENRNIDVNNIRLFKRDTLGVNYTLGKYGLTDNYFSYSNYIPIGVFTDDYGTSPIQYYIYPDVNYTVGNPQYKDYLTFNSFDTPDYNFISTYAFNEENYFEGYNVYVVNSKGNSIYYENINNNLLPSLDNLDIDVNIDKTVSISFKIPDKTDTLKGTKTTNYELNLYDGINLIKQYYFPESDLDNTGIYSYNDFLIEKLIIDNDYYIIVTGDLTDYDLVTGTYEVRAKYNQNNGTTTSTSFLITDNVTVTFKEFALYEWNGTAMLNELTYFDSTSESQIWIFPNIDFGNDIGWTYTYETNNNIDYETPKDFYESILVDLSDGNNIFTFSDSSGVIYTYNIQYKTAYVLTNITLYDDKFNIVCFTNETFSDCDYDILTSEFYTVTNDDNDLGGSFEQDIYCYNNYSSSFELFYNDWVSLSNWKFIPNSFIINFPTSTVLLYNLPFSINDKDLYNYIYDNPDIVYLSNFDFVRRIMTNFVKLRASEFYKYAYLPSGQNCYIEQTYNNVTLNVTFKPTYNLLNDIKSSSLFIQINNECFLNSNQKNGILEYLDYNSCLITSFITDNFNTFYYLTFFMLGLIIYKVITGLI